MVWTPWPLAHGPNRATMRAHQVWIMSSNDEQVVEAASPKAGGVGQVLLRSGLLFVVAPMVLILAVKYLLGF